MLSLTQSLATFQSKKELKEVELLIEELTLRLGELRMQLEMLTCILQHAALDHKHLENR